MTPKPTHADLGGARYLALQRLARAQKRPTAELLQLYVLESFLRRLVRSRHDERLVLKGGLLLAAFELRRATRDVDLLALHTDNDPQAVERLVVEVASVEVEDGVVFPPDTTTTATIRDGDVYPGVRAVLEPHLATARIKFSVDVNVGDPVVPAPARTAVPALLGSETIDVLAYPKSMVVAEKLVTALQRGRASTRWRDFADLFVLVEGTARGRRGRSRARGRVASGCPPPSARRSAGRHAERSAEAMGRLASTARSRGAGARGLRRGAGRPRRRHVRLDRRCREGRFGAVTGDAVRQVSRMSTLDERPPIRRGTVRIGGASRIAARTPSDSQRFAFSERCE